MARLGGKEKAPEKKPRRELRRARESGVADGVSIRNLTKQGAPQTHEFHRRLRANVFGAARTSRHQIVTNGLEIGNCTRAESRF